MKKKQSYFLILLLLFFSGNPLMSFLFGKFGTLIGLILTFLLIHKNINLEKNFFKLYKIIAVTIFFISVCQFLVLDSVSWLGMLNLASKFLLGGIIINHLKHKFIWFFFKVVADLSVISLIFYLIVNIMKVNLPYIDLGFDHGSYIIYTAIFNHDLIRNCGMFWEPGAFAGILTLCLALNFNNLRYYWNNHRYRLMFIILALITSQSTTGYLVGFIIFLFIFINGKNFFIVPLFFIVVIYIYQTNDFLSDKIRGQLEFAQDQDIGEFSNTRFGSAIFDWHYIQKHPLIGNGFDEKTRYSDHQYLFNKVNNDGIGSGNGFTGTLASLGVLFVFSFFYYLWKALVMHNIMYRFLILTVIILNLQGEQWFNFPLYLGLPFLAVMPLEKNLYILRKKFL